MKKITPKEIIGNILQEGEFCQVEEARHKVNKSYWNVPLIPINTRKFGEYFEKCTGTLNSIVKRSDWGKDKHEMVVKQRIGFRICHNGFEPEGNARYAKTDTIYSILNRRHVDLVCKRDKRQIVADFCTLKEDAIVRFHSIVAVTVPFISDQVMVSDAFNIEYHRPTDSYADQPLGFLTANTRIIPKSDVLVCIHPDNRYNEYNANLGCAISCPKKGEMSFTCMIREECETQDGDGSDPKYNFTNLFRVEVDGAQSRYRLNYQMDHYNTQFDGIDVNGMTDAIVFELDKLAKEFDDALEALKEKYIGEFLLSEICDSDNCAI